MIRSNEITSLLTKQKVATNKKKQHLNNLQKTHKTTALHSVLKLGLITGIASPTSDNSFHTPRHAFNKMLNNFLRNLVPFFN